MNLAPDLRSLLDTADALRQRGDLPGAIAHYEHAFKIAPQNEDVLKNLGQSVHLLGMHYMKAKQLEAAKAAYRRALEIDPKSFPTLNDLAMIFQHEGNRPAARELYDRAINDNPDNLLMRYNRSVCALTEGRFAQGWTDFEVSEPHWRPFHDHRKNLPWMAKNVLWKGEDIQGKKILIWGDQGIGDEIVYFSMVPDLIARGAVRTIECTDRLIPLTKRSFPEVRVIERKDPSLLGDEFDFHAPGMWAARWLRPDLAAFPDRRSFMKADPETTARLRARYEAFGKKRIVGVSWFTLSQDWGLKRSMQLPDMLKPLALEDMLIVDLQYANTEGAWEQARRVFPNLTMIHDPEVDQLKDMDMYAAQIAACDYIVTISNTTSHVAGALGVPASILMPVQGLTWYWFESGEKCPWYPSLRLLRPSVPDRLKIAAAEAAGA